MGASPSRDDTEVWKGHGTPRECNEEWSHHLDTYCNIKRFYDDEKNKTRNNEFLPPPLSSSMGSQSNWCSNIMWGSLNPVEKKRMLYQYIKGDPKLEQLMLLVRSKINMGGGAHDGDTSFITTLSSVLPTLGGSGEAASNGDNKGSATTGIQSITTTQTAIDECRKIVEAMNKPLLPYEDGYFKHPWMRWVEVAELTCRVVEYYEVGNVGAPRTRLFTATVGHDGDLLNLELPKKNN